MGDQKTLADSLLIRIKANQPEENLTTETDYLGTIPKGNMITSFLESLPDRKDKNGVILTDIQMIALYGEWGSGKTSLMKYIRAQLDAGTSFKTVFFPAWEMEKDNNLALSLLESIIESASGIDKTDVKGALLAIGAGIGKSLSINIGPIKFSGKEVIQAVEDYNKSITDDSSLKKIHDFKEQYRDLETNILETAKKQKLIVFIDDLDRCEPENVLNLLSAIKLFFTFGNRTIFVCGLDEKAIDEAVKVKYKDVVKSGEYMEKIFDISFDMPKPDMKKMIEFYFNDVWFHSNLPAGEIVQKTIIPDYKEVVSGVQNFLEEMHFTNPRHVKKVLNKYLLIRYYQESRLDKDNLIPDQNIAFFRYLTLFIIMLYKFHKHEFDVLKNYPTKLLNLRDKIKEDTTQRRETEFDNINEYSMKSLVEEALKIKSDSNGEDTELKNILALLFGMPIDNYKPFGTDEYIRQFRAQNNFSALWISYLTNKLTPIRSMRQDIAAYNYILWNVFDMAERYL